MPILADVVEARVELAGPTRTDYPDDWIARLANAPNHAGNWPLVQPVRPSTDATLLDWVCGSDR